MAIYFLDFSQVKEDELDGDGEAEAEAEAEDECGGDGGEEDEGKANRYTRLENLAWSISVF